MLLREQEVTTILVVLAAAAFQSVMSFRKGVELAAMECNLKYRVPAGDVQLLKDRQIPTSHNGKCMLACIMKKLKVLTKKGDFDLRSVQRWLRNQYKDDTAKLADANFVAVTCANSSSTSKSEDECDKATEVMTCVKRQSKLLKKKESPTGSNSSASASPTVPK